MGIFLPAVATLAAKFAVVHLGLPVMADALFAKQFPDHGDVLFWNCHAVSGWPAQRGRKANHGLREAPGEEAVRKA